MTVREYMFSASLNAESLAEILGYKTTGPITKRLDEELPERWQEKLDTFDLISEVKENNSDEPKITDEQIDDWISSSGRESDKDPIINSGTEVIGPGRIKLKTIQGYIEMTYGAAEGIARTRGDDIAAETIHRYTPEYVEAWMDYIKYDERILKYLEMLQLGTPLGNLIGIHAVSIGAYVLARITAKEIAANIARSDGDGTEPQPEI